MYGDRRHHQSSHSSSSSSIRGAGDFAAVGLRRGGEKYERGDI